MTENNAVFHTDIGKRLILVVDDEDINRDLLGNILENDYDLLFAADGEEALRLLQENRNTLSLVILDLIMPKLTGQEVLQQIRASEEYQDIPVIVASGDDTQEIECLNAGASDFISKPYPDPGVILARVNRAIELFESRRIIQSTERDPLTGLYNREFFYSYAAQYANRHPDTENDAILIDINHFGAINERFGRSFADEILRRLGDRIHELVLGAGGIACRREADIFQIYCPHRDDYKAVMDNLSSELSDDAESSGRIRLRMGVYSRVDRTLGIERSFARAKMAADKVRGSYTRNIGVYDDTLHSSELYSMRLLDDFKEALEKGEFEVYFQPQYDIRKESPHLVGAEALVRWNHPELGLLSPGIFIPLFEENGLIRSLDAYVWQKTAEQVQKWKSAGIHTVPVSLNISRIDISDSGIVDTLSAIVKDYGLEGSDLRLEITESAYADDAEQIIEVVMRLRAEGFMVDMDDFGTGYSSLNMLSTLPVDALKLDMKFIQTAFADSKNTQMLGIIIDIARHLSVPVVAEGVETKEQFEAVKEAGCDYIQGYYLASPSPAEEFEALLENTEPDIASDAGVKSRTDRKRRESSFLKGLSSRFGISMSRASIVFIIAAVIAAAALYIADSLVTRNYMKMELASEQYILAQQSAADLSSASDYLTDEVRSFVVTGDISHMDNYFEEADVTQRRDKAVAGLQEMFEGHESAALDHLSTALDYSNELMEQEYLAMSYVLSAESFDSLRIPDVLKTQTVPDISPEELREAAIELVYGNTYGEYKAKIKSETSLCTRELIDISNTERISSGQRMRALLTLQTVLTILLLVIVLLIVIFINAWIRQPLTRMVEQMKAKEAVDSSGAGELRFVTDTYNAIFEENRRTHEHLTYGNMHDALTGLYNRSAYNIMRHDLDMSKNALLLVDVDKFKSVNDTYGHDVGDLVLKRVSEVLKYSFRATDPVFRLGGDEFVVIMVNAGSSLRKLVMNKIEQANVMLQQPTDDLPPTSLSVGVAFGDRENPEGDIFKDADTALYRMKEAGRCGCYIY